MGGVELVSRRVFFQNIFLFLSIMSSRLHRDHDKCLIFATLSDGSDVGMARIHAGPLPVVSSHEKKV